MTANQLNSPTRPDLVSAKKVASRATVHRLEQGDLGISLNTFAMAMFILGRLNAVSTGTSTGKTEHARRSRPAAELEST
ncbi:hypothetical protein [Bradyrhizobium sp. USDA 3315]